MKTKMKFLPYRICEVYLRVEYSACDLFMCGDKCYQCPKCIECKDKQKGTR